MLLGEDVIVIRNTSPGQIYPDFGFWWLSLDPNLPGYKEIVAGRGFNTNSHLATCGLRRDPQGKWLHRLGVYPATFSGRPFTVQNLSNGFWVAPTPTPRHYLANIKKDARVSLPSWYIWSQT